MFRALKKLLGQVQLCCFYGSQIHYRLSLYLARNQSSPLHWQIKRTSKRAEAVNTDILYILFHFGNYFVNSKYSLPNIFT